MKTKQTRIKRPTTPTPISREEAELILNDIALATANKQKLVAAKNNALLAVQKFHAPGIALCDTAIADLTAQLQAWAEANRAVVFAKRKSLVWPGGKFGFRTGTPKLCLLNRKWSWDSVLTKVKALVPDWVRTKEELDKEAVLADHATDDVHQATAEELAKMGMKVTQDEGFFVEPAIESVEARQTTTTPMKEALKAAAVLCGLCAMLLTPAARADECPPIGRANATHWVMQLPLPTWPVTNFTTLVASTNLAGPWQPVTPSYINNNIRYYEGAYTNAACYFRVLNEPVKGK